MSRLDAGQIAPDFTLPSDDEGDVTLSALRGQIVVLYFYPKDDTSGCTAQACEFRDLGDEFAAAGARVLGVSPDPLASHARFRAKHGLGFTLLSDEDHTVSEAYGVWLEKSMYGRTYMGIERSTFVISPDGEILHADYKVKAKGNAAQALGLLSAD